MDSLSTSNVTGASVKIKILILGPVQSGKTTIANYLADATEIIGGEYRPTQGVRIVEFESNDLELNGKMVAAEVELWDCSGDRLFEPCWPAIQRDAHGAILVCNPENETHIAELEQWYSSFVLRRAIDPRHVLLLLHQRPQTMLTTASNHEAIGDFRLPSTMHGVQCLPSNIEQDGDQLRLQFNAFLCNVIVGVR